MHHQDISTHELRNARPPAAMMEERGALLMFGWFVGSIVIGCFALSALALTLDSAPATASLLIALH
jgi:hypothetical protein